MRQYHFDQGRSFLVYFFTFISRFESVLCTMLARWRGHEVGEVGCSSVKVAGDGAKERVVNINFVTKERFSHVCIY